MKSLMNRIAVTLVITALASVSVFAKTRTQTVTFSEDIKVNGTQVAKGVYDVKFDDKTGEVSLMKGSKVIARAPGSLEKRTNKARNFELRFNGRGDDAQLTSVTFAGSQENIVIDSKAASK
jgi:hypothetical protein